MTLCSEDVGKMSSSPHTSPVSRAEEGLGFCNGGGKLNISPHPPAQTSLISGRQWPDTNERLEEASYLVLTGAGMLATAERVSRTGIIDKTLPNTTLL